MHPITAAIEYWLQKGNEKAAAKVWQSLEVGAPRLEDTVKVHEELASLDLIPALLAALKK